MKLQVISDLHLSKAELEQPFQLPRTDAELLIFAGDIANGAARAVHWATGESERLSVPGLFVLGNHEYYRGSFPSALELARAAAPAGAGLRVLERERVEFGEVRILACTLWTDFQLFGPEAAAEARAEIGGLAPDYQGLIGLDGGGKLRPEDTEAAHHQSLRWLESELSRPWAGRTVVVTHFGPHRRTAHPHFDNLATAGFVSDLEGLFRNHSIDVWISGHTHYNHDFIDAGTRFVGNQRGYPNEAVPGAAFDPGLVIEV